MCRNIRPLYNFDPPATEEEVRDAALQFVRKVSGFTKPSHANAEAFERAVDTISAASRWAVEWATSSTARLNASSFACEGLVKPLTLRTYWSAASRISSSVVAGSKL